MDAVFAIAGVVCIAMGFWRWCYLMEHSRDYSIPDGTTYVLIAMILIGIGCGSLAAASA